MRSSKTLRLLANKNLIIIVLCLISIFSLTHNTQIHQNSIIEPIQQQQQQQEEEVPEEKISPILQQQKDIRNITRDYYETVFEMIQAFAPMSEKLERNYSKTCTVRDEGVLNPSFYSETALLDCLQIDPAIKQDLKLKHLNFVENLPKTFPKKIYDGDGIVMVGGGKFSLMSYLSVKMLRDRGNQLPVEVFVPPLDENDYDFCDYLLPSLNAKCIYLSNILSDEKIRATKFKGYQFKSLLLMLSSFANVLLIDADNFIIKPLDHIFNMDPFTHSGLVTWPDYWKRLVTPHYYEIAGIEVGHKRVRFAIDDVTKPSKYTKPDEDPLNDIPFHDRENLIPDGSTESGQLLINKYKHCQTLLLSLYYNVYGPSHYYPMFGQGKAGEGDKDTFLAAANFFKLPWYQVKHPPATAGFNHAGGFKGVAMLQSDPVIDYQHVSEVLPDYQDLEPDYQLSRFNDKLNYKDIMFVHSHLPKFDPVGLFNTKEIIVQGKHIRMYTDLSFYKFDIELKIFKDMQHILCDAGRFKFKYLRDLNVGQLNQLCDFIGEHNKFLQETS